MDDSQSIPWRWARRPDSTDLSAAAKRVLGQRSLRSGRLEALRATMSGRESSPSCPAVLSAMSRRR